MATASEGPVRRKAPSPPSPSTVSSSDDDHEPAVTQARMRRSHPNRRLSPERKTAGGAPGKGKGLGVLDVLRVLAGVLLLNCALSYLVTNESVTWGWRPWWSRPEVVRSWIVSCVFLFLVSWEERLYGGLVAWGDTGEGYAIIRWTVWDIVEAVDSVNRYSGPELLTYDIFLYNREAPSASPTPS